MWIIRNCYTVDCSSGIASDTGRRCCWPAAMGFVVLTTTGSNPSLRMTTTSLIPKPQISIPLYLRSHFRFYSNAPKIITATASRFPLRISSTSTNSAVTPTSYASTSTRWIVIVETPPGGLSSKSEIVDYYGNTLARVLGCEKEAQMCIYDVSWQNHFGFCCDIEEETARHLARIPGVLSVRPDDKDGSIIKDYSFTSSLSGHLKSNSPPVLGKNSNYYWLVQMERPKVEVVTKAQVVDYYAQTLTKVLGNEKDAQMSIYDISWEKDFGFCCHIDEECAHELNDIPGILSVRPDVNFNSENKDYKGVGILQSSVDSLSSSKINQSPKTKRLFVTGLSFYTSEKTLRAAFEGYGELVEVKIIMDKISKRSKGYAFIEYTTEDAAAAALKEMNGKIINGWMIVVDVAITNPPRTKRGQSRRNY